MMADVVCDRNFPCTALHDKSWLVAIVEERSFGTFHEPSQDTRASSWSLALLTHSRSPFYDLPSRVRQPSFLSPSQASFRRLLPFAFLLSVGIPSIHAADSTSPSTPHALDLCFEVTTFVLNLEKQGLQHNTFTNGIGVDTTLIGDFLNVSLHRQLAPRLDADLGVFINIPFGYDTVVSQVRPIARLTYTPVDDVTARVGTLKVPHRDFLNAVFMIRIASSDLSSKERRSPPLCHGIARTSLSTGAGFPRLGY